MKFDRVWEGTLDGRHAFTNGHCVFVLPTPQGIEIAKFDKPNEIQRAIDALRPKQFLSTKRLRIEDRPNVRAVVVSGRPHPHSYDERYWNFAIKSFPTAEPALAKIAGHHGERLLVFIEKTPTGEHIMAAIMPLQYTGEK